jgi:UPF0755 protein
MSPRARQREAAQRPSLARRLLRGCLWTLLLVTLLLAGSALAFRIWMRAGLSESIHPDGELVWDVPAGTSSFRAVELAYQAAGREIGQRERALMWIVDLPDCVQRGEHRLAAGAGFRELLTELCRPTASPAARVTLPERWNQWEIARRVAAEGVTDEEAFLAAVAAAAPVWAPAGAGAEGYLFADTYEFYTPTPADEVVQRLVDEATEQYGRAFAESGVSVGADPAAPIHHGLSAHELIILASMVEAESAVASERPLIARVFLNRLAQRMPLQSDPTCVYGREFLDQVATTALCRDATSVYSTYVVPALPAGPIGNPGVDSLRAVLQPADDPDVLYFVAIGDDSGAHLFADSYDEHRRNVAAYRARVRGGGE